MGLDYPVCGDHRHCHSGQFTLHCIVSLHQKNADNGLLPPHQSQYPGHSGSRTLCTIHSRHWGKIFGFFKTHNLLENYSKTLIEISIFFFKVINMTWYYGDIYCICYRYFYYCFLFFLPLTLLFLAWHLFVENCKWNFAGEEGTVPRPWAHTIYIPLIWFFSAAFAVPTVFWSDVRPWADDFYRNEAISWRPNDAKVRLLVNLSNLSMKYEIFTGIFGKLLILNLLFLKVKLSQPLKCSQFMWKLLQCTSFYDLLKYWVSSTNLKMFPISLQVCMHAGENMLPGSDYFYIASNLVTFSLPVIMLFLPWWALLVQICACCTRKLRSSEFWLSLMVLFMILFYEASRAPFELFNYQYILSNWQITNLEKFLPQLDAESYR